MARATWLAAAVLLGIAATLVDHSHHSLALGLAVLALVALVPAVWDVETALAFLLVFMPFRTMVETVSPLPLHFVADLVVLVLVLRVLILHPRTVLPLDAIEVFGLIFIVVGLALTEHAHSGFAAGALEVRDLFLFWLLYAAVRRLARAGDGPTADFWPRAVALAVAAIAIIGIQGLLGMATGLGQHFLLPGAWQTEAISTVNRGRPYGLVNNPNVFGELGAVALILAYSRLRANGLRPLLLVLLPSAFFLAMVLFSYSRTAWIVTGLAMAVYFVVASGMRERLGILVAAVALGAAIVALPHAHHRVTTVASRQSLRQSKRAGRLETLRLAAQLVRREPLGTGLGTFGSGASRVFHEATPGVPHQFYADDNYAALLVETGPIGFVLFLLLGISVYARIFRAQGPPDERRLALVLFLVLTVIAATSNGWEQLNLTVYPWVALAIAASDRAGSLRLGGLSPRLHLRGA